MGGKVYRNRYYIFVALVTVTVVVFGLFQSANALDCYDDKYSSNVVDCLLHTGCMKKFFIKNQTTTRRGCFLTKGHGDSCENLNEHEGICFCHTDLCNGSINSLPSGISITIGILCSWTLIQLI